MWSLVIIEVNRTLYGGPDLFDAGEPQAFQQLILHRVVDSLCLSIILRIACLGHTDADVVFLKETNIFRTCILAASVRVVDKIVVRPPINAFKRHPEGFDRIGRLKRWADTPADDLLSIGIQDEG